MRTVFDLADLENSQFIYQTGFAEQIHLYGLAAAASLSLAVFLIVLTLAQLRLTRASQAGQKVK